MTHHPSTRIAVIAPNWLGDAVMCLPLIGMLRRAERVQLSVMCPPYTARVYAGIDGIDELIVFSKRGFTRGLNRRSRILRRLRPEAVIVLPPSFSSAMSTAAARIPLRVGYATDGRRTLLNCTVPDTRLREEHLSQSYMHLGTHALACIGAAYRGAGNAAAAAEDAPQEAAKAAPAAAPTGATIDDSSGEVPALSVFPGESRSRIFA
jgi:heptosyltransferase-2